MSGQNPINCINFVCVEFAEHFAHSGKSELESNSSEHFQQQLFPQRGRTLQSHPEKSESGEKRSEICVLLLKANIYSRRRQPNVCKMNESAGDTPTDSVMRVTEVARRCAPLMVKCAGRKSPSVGERVSGFGSYFEIKISRAWQALPWLADKRLADNGGECSLCVSCRCLPGPSHPGRILRVPSPFL